MAKPEKNKGAQKQEMWTECIQELSEASHFDQQTRNVLQRIASQSNVPRKKPKFINFLKSSMRWSPTQAEKIWTIIEKGLEEFKKKTAPPTKPETVTTSSDTPIANGSSEHSTENAENSLQDNENASVGTSDEVLTVTNEQNQPTTESILEHALAETDLDKSTKKLLKKLQKRTNIPLIARKKQKKLTKFLKDELQLDAETASKVCDCLLQSVDTLLSNDNNVSTASKKRKLSDVDDENSVGGKKAKTEVSLADSTTDANGESTFDWQKHIQRIFNKNQQNNQIAVDMLKSKVIKKFLKSVGDVEDSKSAQYDKKFKKHLKKIQTLSLSNGIVQLKV